MVQCMEEAAKGKVKAGAKAKKNSLSGLIL